MRSNPSPKTAAEKQRLTEDKAGKQYWRRWGPYLSERQWGTVREDYSPGGTAWEYFPHDHARSRAYRWGEDGIAGFSDDLQHLCLSLALWNGKDPILKERLFGLTNAEGNHGEDVKELYYYLDATPTTLVFEDALQISAGGISLCAARRGKSRDAAPDQPEFELLDTGLFDDEPLLRCLRGIRQGRAGRHSHAGDGSQSRAGDSEADAAAATLFSQHLVVESEFAQAQTFGGQWRRQN